MKEEILSICLSCGQFLVMLRGNFGMSLFYVLTLHYLFSPPPTSKLAVLSFSEGDDEEIHICLSQVVEHGFTTK